MTKIFGILNITPDSFSDGGKFNTIEKAVSASLIMVSDGAEIIDIGAESTRPNAEALTPEVEWERLKHILKEVKSTIPKNIEISIDTRNFKTAENCLKLGVDYINDVSGISNKNMVSVVKNSDCKIVYMHSLSIPADKNIILDEGCDVIDVLSKWNEEKLEMFDKARISNNRLIFDAGLGFGKTAVQSLDIIKNFEQLKNNIKLPILIGHSRKSMYKHFGIDDANNRLTETIATSTYLTERNVDYLRVHDVAENFRAVKLTKYLLS